MSASIEVFRTDVFPKLSFAGGARHLKGLFITKFGKPVVH